MCRLIGWMSYSLFINIFRSFCCIVYGALVSNFVLSFSPSIPSLNWNIEQKSLPAAQNGAHTMSHTEAVLSLSVCVCWCWHLLRRTRCLLSFVILLKWIGCCVACAKGKTKIFTFQMPSIVKSARTILFIILFYYRSHPRENDFIFNLIGTERQASAKSECLKIIW